MLKISNAHAQAVLTRLCEPIPPQGLTDALAKASCDNCAVLKDEVPCTRCFGMFAVQSKAVAAYIRSLAEGVGRKQ